MTSPISDWQLPRGVTRSLWDYSHADHIAFDYDDHFADSQLFEFDESIVLEHCTPAGLVVDLGCGTGRVLVPLARRGFACVGVDLSVPMLTVVGQKAREEGLTIHRLRANLVELDALADGVADYCLLLFSTLGMIRGRQHRAQLLAHARRILKPGGLFVCHVHNRWYNLFDPQGRRWLWRNWWRSRWDRHTEWGDKVYHYRGIPQMFIHVFSGGEFRRALETAGFRVRAWTPLDTHRYRPLVRSWCLGSWRANGWIAVCEVPARPSVRTGD